MKKLIALSRCLLLTALAGCSILVPPGARFTAEQNAFITPGVTHRDDVIRTLGEPKADFPDLRIIVYARVMEGKRTLLDHLVGYHPYVTTQLFLIVFDPNDRVIKFETIRPQLNIPLRHRALKWAEHEGWPIPKRPTTFVAQEIPPGKSVLYIYRPTGEVGQFEFLVGLTFVADQAAEAHAAGIGVFQNALGDVVGRVHGHHLAGHDDVDFLRLVLADGHGETAAHHIAEHVVGNALHVIVSAVLFQEVDGSNHATTGTTNAGLWATGSTHLMFL